jgi:hypothetical protein
LKEKEEETESYAPRTIAGRPARATDVSATQSPMEFPMAMIVRPIMADCQRYANWIAKLMKKEKGRRIDFELRRSSPVSTLSTALKVSIMATTSFALDSQLTYLFINMDQKRAEKKITSRESQASDIKKPVHARRG